MLHTPLPYVKCSEQGTGAVTAISTNRRIAILAAACGTDTAARRRVVDECTRSPPVAGRCAAAAAASCLRSCVGMTTSTQNEWRCTRALRRDVSRSASSTVTRSPVRSTARLAHEAHGYVPVTEASYKRRRGRRGAWSRLRSRRSAGLHEGDQVIAEVGGCLPHVPPVTRGQLRLGRTRGMARRLVSSCQPRIACSTPRAMIGNRLSACSPSRGTIPLANPRRPKPKVTPT